MSKNHHGGPAPVPPGNRPQGPDAAAGPGQGSFADADTGASFQDQDPKRRLGNFSGAGEHPRQQPGAANDGDKHSR